jgi:phospholipid/cholesterol/gamma-HCH transport system substrate-binding protein
MKITHETKIGIIVTIAIAAAIWGINFLKGRNILKPITNYVTIYEDIGGLEINAKVFMNGYKVGQVSEISFNDDRSGNLTVILGIDKGHKIPLNSVAEIFSVDLLGTKAISIIQSESDQYHHSGDTLATAFQPELQKKIEEEIIPLKDKAEKLIVTVDSVLQNLNDVFDDKTGAALQKTVYNIEASTEQLDEMLSPDGKLTKMIGHIESITMNIKNNNDDISKAISNLSAISDSIARSDLKSTITRTNETLEQTYEILRKINEGEGTIGLLVNNDSLYHNLESLSRDLDILMTDLKENPGKYINVSVFGRSNKKNKNTD